MLMMRDWRLCWIVSILFELLELTFQFLLPDFRECWWDSIFLDALGANVVGMVCGWAILWCLREKWSVRSKFNWIGREGEEPQPASSWTALFNQIIWRLSPKSWPRYHWAAFSSFKRFMIAQSVIWSTCLVEMNLFFLMHLLWVPPKSDISGFRMGVICMVSVPAFAEFYNYVTDPEAKRIGQNTWLMLAVALLESLICIKFGRSVYTATPPFEIWGPWLAYFSIQGTWAYLFFVHYKRPEVNANSSDPKPKWKNGWLDVLFFSSFLPLLFLCRLWAWK
jgi:hypothetical protein